MERHRLPTRRQARLEKSDEDQKFLPYFSLFRYSTFLEKTLIIIAIFLAIVSGCFPPTVNVLYGEFCNLMIDRQFPTNIPSSETFLIHWFGGGKILQNASSSERSEALKDDSKAWGIACTVFTFLQFLFSLLSVALLNAVASKQILRIKILLFKSILCNDMAWFDVKMNGDFVGNMSERLFLAEKGIGDILSVFTFQVTAGFMNIVISFILGWRLTLLLVMFIIPVFIASFFKGKAQNKHSVNESESFTKAGKTAEEVFTSIKTVVAFAGEEKEIEGYSKCVEKIQKAGIKRGMISGFSNGCTWLIIYCSYAVAFIFGVRLILVSKETGDREYTPAILLIVFFGIVTALTNLGFALTLTETISVAREAANSVFNIIKTRRKINGCSNDGIIPSSCEGEIIFNNVYFEYPSRPSGKILKGLDLKLNPREVVAIVGGSGSGKSTVLHLVQRLYDPTEGNIFLDGRPINLLNVSWLRQQLGVVGQEPLLFSTTIGENILYGNSSATYNEMIEAAKQANAHDFIMNLKDGYSTVIGPKGSTLSRGQKQRIAIARALIRNPKILLLDEVTSALDSNSEIIVQAALESAAQNRTTLIVTHKLSTITNVDRIVVLANGVVAEHGTHNELIANNHIYKRLFEKQGKKIVLKEKTVLMAGSTTSTLPKVYEETTLIPPGPRSRFSSIGNVRRDIKLHTFDTHRHYRVTSFSEIIRWSKPDWKYLTCGCLASVIGGTALPVVCILFCFLLGLLSLSDAEYIKEQTDIYALILLVVGIFTAACVFVQMYCFASASMDLYYRLTMKAFRSMIQQEIAYFDNDNNKVGALCMLLTQDPSKVKELMGVRLGIILQAVSTMTIGIILSFFFAWKISFVGASTVPFVFLGVLLEAFFAQTTFGNSGRGNASKFAVEVFENIKAVTSLGKESYFVEKYSEVVRKENSRIFAKAFLRGFGFALGQTAPFFGYALTLWYGGVLVAEENLHYKYVIMVSELLIFGAWTLGQSVIIGPSFNIIKFAAGRLNYIFFRESKMMSGSLDVAPDIEKKGLISYSKVSFSYPKRPGISVLQDFSMVVNPGETVVLTGPNGTGKSTVIQLLLRFYDPVSGAITINDVKLEDFKLSSLREKLGIISQEPVLFDRTIQENIAYGDNLRVVPLSEIREAAKAANIDSFIMSLPLGYETRVGPSTIHLTVGQKQRIAIARVLIRNPRILLLDEATSSLDLESEAIVQEALNSASEKRTTISVAHRLSAIRNADFIYVMENGSVVESGIHEELMELQGLYYTMYKEQYDEEEHENKKQNEDEAQYQKERYEYNEKEQYEKTGKEEEEGDKKEEVDKEEEEDKKEEVVKEEKGDKKEEGDKEEKGDKKEEVDKEEKGDKKEEVDKEEEGEIKEKEDKEEHDRNNQPGPSAK